LEDEEIERIKAKKLEKIMKELVKREDSKALHVTDSSFDVLLRKYNLLVIDCWAPWCGPCRMLSPIIDEMASRYLGKIVFGKLNVDENPEIPMRFGVNSIPTLLIFKEGKLVDRIVGAVPKVQLESILAKHV